MVTASWFWLHPYFPLLPPDHPLFLGLPFPYLIIPSNINSHFSHFLAGIFLDFGLPFPSDLLFFLGLSFRPYIHFAPDLPFFLALIFVLVLLHSHRSGFPVLPYHKFLLGLPFLPIFSPFLI